MGSMVTMDVIAASVGLESFLQAAPWESQIAAVFDRSLLRTAPDERLLHLHTGPRLASPFNEGQDAVTTLVSSAVMQEQVHTDACLECGP